MMNMTYKHLYLPLLFLLQDVVNTANQQYLKHQIPNTWCLQEANAHLQDSENGSEAGDDEEDNGSRDEEEELEDDEDEADDDEYMQRLAKEAFKLRVHIYSLARLLICILRFAKEAFSLRVHISCCCGHAPACSGAI